jgi:hypothetical protein
MTTGDGETTPLGDWSDYQVYPVYRSGQFDFRLYNFLRNAVPVWLLGPVACSGLPDWLVRRIADDANAQLHRASPARDMKHTSASDSEPLRPSRWLHPSTCRTRSGHGGEGELLKFITSAPVARVCSGDEHAKNDYRSTHARDRLRLEHAF